MTSEVSPFVEANYGWPLGSDGWNQEMDMNLVKFSYLHDHNIDAIVSSLPAIVDGTAYFNTTDNRLYFDANGQRYSSGTPKWFEVTLRATGQVYQFDGTTLNIGTAYTDALRSDLANPADPSKGAILVGSDDPLATTAARMIDRLPSRHGRASAADLPRFMNTIRSYRHDLQGQIPIVGVGSSVGNGAALPDPSTDAPVAYFKSQLESIFDPGNLYNIVVSNQSVNGSVIADFPTAWAAILALGHTTPGIVVFAYGMNDQQPAAYNSGQTFPGFNSQFRSAVKTVRDAGWDAVIATSPHCSVVRFPALLSMPPAVPQTYPTAISAPVSDSALQPSAATGSITADFLGDGTTITLSHRALRINQAMRNIAREFNCPLIDAELYWLEALQKYKLLTGSMAAAEGSLYDGAENVHPNLLGHQLSYQRGIRDFLQGFARQAGQPSFEARLNGRIGVNSDLPTSVLEVKPAYGDTNSSLAVWSPVGQADGGGVKASGLVAEIDSATGDLVLYTNTTNVVVPVAMEGYRVHLELDGTGTVIKQTRRTRKINGMTISEIIENGFNLGASVQSPSFTFPDNSWGSLSVDGFQNGIGRQRTTVEWVAVGGAVTFSAATNVQSAGAVFTGPAAAGLVPQVTNAAANTTLVWEIEYRV